MTIVTILPSLEVISHDTIYNKNELKPYVYYVINYEQTTNNIRSTKIYFKLITLGILREFVGHFKCDHKRSETFWTPGPSKSNIVIHFFYKFGISRHYNWCDDVNQTPI